MASPFSGFQNLRVVISQRRLAPSLRDGVTQQGPPEQVVVELFAKVQGSGSGGNLPSIEVGAGSCSGFIVRWAPLQQGQDWLTSGDYLRWTDDGLRPDLLTPGMTCRGFLGDLTLLPEQGGGQLGELEITELGQPFGVGGIGALIRAAAGDKFTGTWRASR